MYVTYIWLQVICVDTEGVCSKRFALPGIRALDLPVSGFQVPHPTPIIRLAQSCSWGYLLRASSLNPSLAPTPWLSSDHPRTHSVKTVLQSTLVDKHLNVCHWTAFPPPTQVAPRASFTAGEGDGCFWRACFHASR